MERFPGLVLGRGGERCDEMFVERGGGRKGSGDTNGSGDTAGSFGSSEEPLPLETCACACGGFNRLVFVDTRREDGPKVLIGFAVENAGIEGEELRSGSES